MRKVLGISAFYHDSAASLVVGGKVVAAAQEERFTREKHTADFPVNAIKYCLDFMGLDIDELDAIVFYDKPFLKFERLLETYYAFVPKGLVSFLRAMPVWIREKLFLKKMMYDGMKEVGLYNKSKMKLLFTEHHLSHAASAFYPSPFEHAAILTIDGVGEWCTASISVGEGPNITQLKELTFPHSVGLLYSAFTYYLGFKVNSGEYKLMGLAPYGNDNEETQRYISIIKQKLVNIKEDGSIWLDQGYFNYAVGSKMAKDQKWEKLFGFARRKAETELKQKHCNLALAIQRVTEEIVLKMAIEAKRITGSNNLCLAGGVALNCVSNGKLIKESLFKDIFVQPASGDAGGALGAALAVSQIYFGEERKVDSTNDEMQGAYLGPEYSDKEIEVMSRKTQAVYTKYDQFDDLTKSISQKIADGKVIGWFQGRMEFGPRALGNRSILGDASNKDMQKRINLKIKKREGFRPFAPSVLKEDMVQYFDLIVDSPYMLFVAPVKSEKRKNLPSNYASFSMSEKLNFERSEIQSVTHCDFSSRVQTVSSEKNSKFWELINKVKNVTGSGIVINTSFNVRGEPIVCSPYDAYRCFMSTDMDYLVINNYVYVKTDQLNYADKKKWEIIFNKD